MSTQASQDGPIIVIDDDQTMRRACLATLERMGCVAEAYPDGPSGLERVGATHPGLLVVDLKMPGMSGLEVIRAVKELDPDVVIVVITGFATVGTAVEAMKAGAYDFIPKPFTGEELRVIIRRALEHRQLVLETRRLREEKAAQARRHITFVSHQLQSPLGAIQQYLDVLAHLIGPNLTPQQAEWIDRCRGKLREMLAIISDWLTLAKVESGRFATERQPVRWQDLIGEMWPGFVAAGEERRVMLHNEVSADLPAVLGDAAALRVVLANLVGNAVKYNRDGGQVLLRASADEHSVALSVVDTGVGIAPEHHARVFEEFFRGPGANTGGTSGTGLGLPICRRIAEELSGALTVTSRAGEGSTFTLTLPRAAQTP